MDVSISSKTEHDYLLIETRGVILDSDEHKQLTLQFYNEIVKYNSEKIIIDVSKITFPKSLEFHSYIVEFYKEELPEEVKLWRIAVIDTSNYRELGKYWEYKANNNGYNNFKVFNSKPEAILFINY